jgi:hypothetical protein
MSREHFPGKAYVSRSFPQIQAESSRNDVLKEKGLLLSSPESGLIVLSSSARILHMNGPARALMALFGTSYELWPQMAPESMPPILKEFCYDVLAQLKRRIREEDWTQFEMRRTCHMITPSLLLIGFGVPATTNREIRIILTLNPVPCTSEDSLRRHLPADIQAFVSGSIS